MAHLIFNNAFVLINSVDLSAQIKSVAWPMTREQKDNTVMGNTAKAVIPGLADSDIQIEFFQDFAAAQVDATLSPLFLNATAFAVEVKPVNAARSTTNPSYTVTAAYLVSYNPMAGALGDIMMAPITIKPAQTTPPTRLTA